MITNASNVYWGSWVVMSLALRDVWNSWIKMLISRSHWLDKISLRLRKKDFGSSISILDNFRLSAVWDKCLFLLVNYSFRLGRHLFVIWFWLKLNNIRDCYTLQFYQPYFALLFHTQLQPFSWASMVWPSTLYFNVP